MMACLRCLADPQPADFGSPRRCAFDDDDNFTPENWNCATISRLYAAADTDVAQFSGNDETGNAFMADPEEDGGFIVVTRYKHRGKTSSAIHVGDFYPPRPVTLALVNRAISSYLAADINAARFQSLRRQ